MGPGRSFAALGTFLVLGLVCLGTSSCKLVVPPKIMVVMMENKSFGDVIGQSDQPFTNELANDYGLVTKSYSAGHPSLPDYLTLASGSNQGVTTDDDPSSTGTFDVPTLASELEAAGITFEAFAEEVPADPSKNGGPTDSNGNALYAVRHVPWEYFDNPPPIVNPGTDNSALMADLNSSKPPDFVWYTPNLVHDEHDGTVEQGDAFLKSFIPEVQGTGWYKSGGQIIVEWDESDDADTSGINGGDGGHIPTIVVSASLAANPRQYSAPVSTAGIMNSIEHMYQVPYLDDAGNSANGNIDSLLYW